MKDELQLKLVEILTAIQGAAKSGTDFAMEQLPDIALQYIMYGRSIHLFWVVLGAISLWRCFVFGKKMMMKDVYSDESFAYFLCTVTFGALGLISLFDNLDSLVLAWAAPKIYLLQGIASLIK